MSVVQAVRRFSDEDRTEGFFAKSRWPDGVRCPFCDSDKIAERPTRKPQPFRCKTRGCRKDFSVKTGTVMHGSKLPLSIWALAIYILTNHPKGESSNHLRSDLGVSYTTAWHMLHRIRETWDTYENPFQGPVQVDETCIGGSDRNRHEWKVEDGRGPEGKAPVPGMRDRTTGKAAAGVVETTDKHALQGLAAVNTEVDATVYTDDAAACTGMRRRHETVRHSVKEFVRGQAHTNGVESFWATLKRGCTGTHHKMSEKRLHRHVGEFAGRHKARPVDTETQMSDLVVGGAGERLRCKDLIGPKYARQPKML